MNVAQPFTEAAFKNPHKKAVIQPVKRTFRNSYHYKSLSFDELEALCNSYAIQFEKYGLKKGMKTLLFIKPCLEFPAMVFALFKIGVVPILIDPGMGKKNLLKAIVETTPDAMIAEPIIHYLSKFHKGVFKKIDIKITHKSAPFAGAYKLSNHIPTTKQFYPPLKMNQFDLAAILFTSGGTGKPKGVEYTHEVFITQIKILKDLFKLNENEIDLPGFPLFALFTLSIGMTSVIPDMDPSKPSKANPKKLVRNIIDQKASFLAGSPAIWKNVAKYCLKEKIILPSVKYLVMFGAPIPNSLHRDFCQILPHGDTYTPYGATESLPITNISGSEILRDTAKLTADGKGTCVGRAAPFTEIKIIEISYEAIENLKDAKVLSTNEIGEIIVSGPVVTKSYYQNELANKLSKIYDCGKIWHRIGDLGYLDESDRLWFYGRKAHAFTISNRPYFTIPCETIANNHPSVQKSALVKLKKNQTDIAALIIETSSLTNKTDRLIDEVKEILKHNKTTDQIDEVYFYPKFPVDVRHNIKIDRPKLAEYVQKKVLRKHV
ncbi:MAG: AMP-binding protein [Halobacteriovoraceae bacterium]|nr:AMP-binding protein [Halobacteriovoraceae bacterium]